MDAVGTGEPGQRTQSFHAGHLTPLLTPRLRGGVDLNFQLKPPHPKLTPQEAMQVT